MLGDENHSATTALVEEISRQVSRFSHPGDDDGRYNFYEATQDRGTILIGDLSEFRKNATSE